MEVLVILGIIALLFIILGILFWNEKALFLIAGYNDLPEEQKQGASRKRRARGAAIGMFFSTGNMLIVGLFAYLLMTRKLDKGILTIIFVAILCIWIFGIFRIKNRINK